MTRRPTGAAAAAAAAGALKTQELYDYAVSKPEGFTCHEAMNKFDWGSDMFQGAVRRLRRYLRNDSLNLVCNSTGRQSVYQLIGTGKDAEFWAAGRLKTLEKQAETMMYVSESVIAGLQPGTSDFLRAQLMERHIGRLLEDLTSIREQPTLF